MITSVNTKSLLQTSTNLLDHFCNKTIKSDNQLSEFLEMLISRQLSETYSYIEKCSNSLELPIENIEISGVNLEDYNSNFLSPIAEMYSLINNEYSELFKYFYIHGSMATLDFIEGWSDVDTFAVVENSTLNNQLGLIELKKAIKHINFLATSMCPFQHHGVMLLTSHNLNLYDKSILPLEVFKYFKSLKLGCGDLKVHCVEGNQTSKARLEITLKNLILAHEKGILQTHAYGNEYLLANYKNKENGMYQFKYYLEQFTLLPSLYLNSLGRPCYKGDSFKEIESFFSNQTMEFIYKISFIRENWHKKEGLEYSKNSIPSWIQELIPQNYFELGSLIAEEILDLVKKNS